MNQWLEEHRVAALTVVGLLLAASVAAFALRWRPAAEIVIEPPATPEPTPTPSPILVYVSGAVVQADVYTLPPGSIVRDAVAAAGGAAPDADLNHVNLALRLEDGDHVYVPRVGELPTPMPTSGGKPVISGPININTATQAELETLPGIGPTLAAAIVEYREKNGPFATIEDIQDVPGIGPSKYEAIRDLITAN